MGSEIVNILLNLLSTDAIRPLLVATICMFSGFFGLNRAYVDDDRDASTLLLAFFMCLTGIGSCAGIRSCCLWPMRLGFNAALNAAAKNFPESQGSSSKYSEVYRIRDRYLDSGRLNGLSVDKLLLDSRSRSLCFHVWSHRQGGCTRRHWLVSANSRCSFRPSNDW